jgi:Nucleotide-sugar transporter
VWLFGAPGLAASALSGLSSAYAGVYFEKYVKSGHSPTLLVRNLQLSLYGLPLSFVYMAARDGRKLSQGGLMQGFNLLAWAVVALQVGLGCNRPGEPPSAPWGAPHAWPPAFCSSASVGSA